MVKREHYDNGESSRASAPGEAKPVRAPSGKPSFRGAPPPPPKSKNWSNSGDYRDIRDQPKRDSYDNGSSKDDGWKNSWKRYDSYEDNYKGKWSSGVTAKIRQD